MTETEKLWVYNDRERESIISPRTTPGDVAAAEEDDLDNDDFEDDEDESALATDRPVVPTPRIPSWSSMFFNTAGMNLPSFFQGSSGAVEQPAAPLPPVRRPGLQANFSPDVPLGRRLGGWISGVSLPQLHFYESDLALPIVVGNFSEPTDFRKKLAEPVDIIYNIYPDDPDTRILARSALTLHRIRRYSSATGSNESLPQATTTNPNGVFIGDIKVDSVIQDDGSAPAAPEDEDYLAPSEVELISESPIENEASSSNPNSSNQDGDDAAIDLAAIHEPDSHLLSENEQQDRRFAANSAQEQHDQNDDPATVIRHGIDFLSSQVRQKTHVFPQFLTSGSIGNCHFGGTNLLGEIHDLTVADETVDQVERDDVPTVFFGLEPSHKLIRGVNMYSPEIRTVWNKRECAPLFQQCRLMIAHAQLWLKGSPLDFSFNDFPANGNSTLKHYDDLRNLFEECDRHVLTPIRTRMGLSDQKSVRLELTFAHDDALDDPEWPITPDLTEICAWFNVASTTHVNDFLSTLYKQSVDPLRSIFCKRQNNPDRFSNEAKTAIIFHLERIVLFMDPLGYKGTIHDAFITDHPCEVPVEAVMPLSVLEQKETGLLFGIDPWYYKCNFRTRLSVRKDMSSWATQSCQFFTIPFAKVIDAADLLSFYAGAVDAVFKTLTSLGGSFQSDKEFSDAFLQCPTFSPIDYALIALHLSENTQAQIIWVITMSLSELYDTIWRRRINQMLKRRRLPLLTVCPISTNHLEGVVPDASSQYVRLASKHSDRGNSQLSRHDKNCINTTGKCIASPSPITAFPTSPCQSLI